MATAARPQATATPVESKSTAMALYKKTEIAAFTSDNAKALLTPMLPAGVSYETVLSELYFAVQKNPEIAKCEPNSMLMAVQRCLSWGLAIGEKAHLVPFKGKLTAVRDYKGDVELVVRAGGAKSIDAYVVWSDEAFDYQLGDSPFVRHRPALKRKEGATIVAAYAVAHIGTNLPPKIVIMGVDEINAIRTSKSKSWVTETYWENGTKKTRPYRIEQIPWYCEKTVVHKIVKQLPTTPALQAVATQLEEEIITDAIVEDAPSSGEKGEERAPAFSGGTGPDMTSPDGDGVVEEPGDGPRNGPPCPKCGAAMRDDRTTKTNVKAPDYKCVGSTGYFSEDGDPVMCEGLYWPGQWPPKPLATDEQRAEIGRLSALGKRVGLKQVTIDAANRKCADPALKAYKADEYIAALKEKIAEKEQEEKRDATTQEIITTGKADSSPATKELF